MKRLICTLMILALLTGAGLAETAGNRLGLEILSAMADGTENAAVSPLSLYLALDLARQGAVGKTREELDALLAGETVDTSLLAEAGLRLANAGFVSGDYEILPEYRKKVDAEWFPLDAGAETVNAWVREKTNGLIERLLDDSPSDETALYLVNALAMEEKWLHPFNKDNSYQGVFHAPEKEEDIKFLYNARDFRYGERDGVQIVSLPYEDSTLAMYVALPEKGGVPALLAALAENGAGYFDVVDGYRKVELSLPPFSLSTGNSLLEALKARGLNVAASDAADFSALCNQPIKIGNVLQKVRIDVDADGTRAAAATAVEMLAAGEMAGEEPEPVVMTVDRPFVIVILDTETGAIAFAATVASVA